MSSRSTIAASGLVLTLAGCVELAEPDADIETDASALSTSRTVLATQIWPSTGLTVKPGDQVAVTWTGGLAYPWGGHQGFTGLGSPTTFWTSALSGVCSFGSLIYRIGTSPAFCYGSLQSNRAGTLALAFNDGVNFADNLGSWSVNVQLRRPWVGMPFTGTFGSAAANPATHTVHDGAVAQWATDVYAPGGTEVRYFGAPWMSAIVSLVQDTPCSVGGVQQSVGKTVFVELFNNNHGVSNRIGRAIYTHLDQVPALSQTQPLAQGARLGFTRLWPRVVECYDVQTQAQVHVHVEVGTHPNAQRSSNVACWRPSNATSVGAGAVIGYYGTTGLTARQQCATEP
jgi:hypothetical protein